MRFSLLIVSVILALMTVCRGSALAEDDWQYWSAVFVKHPINKNIEAKLEREYRESSGGGGYYYDHTDIGLTSRVSSKFTLGFNYRQILERSKDKQSEESRYHVNGTYKWMMGSFEFSDRNRIEYRILHPYGEMWRYRNSLKVSLPPKWITGCRIVPVVMDEVFFNMGNGDFTRNRLYLGFETRSRSNCDWELFYLRQATKITGQWNHSNAIVARCILKF